jgi:hypothetical protein
MIRQIALMVLLFGWTLCAASAQQTPAEKGNPAPTQDAPKTPPTAQKQTSEPKQEEQKDKAPLYYDRRERIAATLTFVWQLERSIIHSKSYLKMGTVVEDENDATKPLPEGVVEVDEGHLMIQGLQGVYRIERTPTLTHLKQVSELPLISGGTVRKWEEPYEWRTYYLGHTGEMIVSAAGSKDIGISIAFAGKNGFGLPRPFIGPMPEDLCVLAGVSPFRLMGAEPSDWRLVSVSEEEWVFELKPEEERKSQMEGAYFSSSWEIRVHLSRRHDDAIKRLEIDYGGGTYHRCDVLSYKQVQGVWMPEQVQVLDHSPDRWDDWTIYTLSEVYRTGGVVVDLPWGASVSDWRLYGRSLWKQSLTQQEPLKVEWSPELLRDLWRQVRESGGERKVEKSD